MIGKKLWCIVSLMLFALTMLGGCGGTTGGTKVGESGTTVTVGGQVETKSAGKSVFLSATSAGATNNVFVYDAQNGAQLGTAAIASDGTFSNLTFTLPAAKTVLVFKAVVAGGPFRTIVPIDLSNPPTGAITGANTIKITIDKASTDIATIVSSLLGLTGVLGDPGMTLDSKTLTYTDAAIKVVDFGGQQLAYNTSGLALTGKFTSAALLPAQDANTLAADELNNMTLDGSISTVSIPGNNPIVSFQVVNKTTGKGIRGLKAFNLVIAQLKPGTAGSPDEWLSYMVTPTDRPTTDSGYTVIDNGDGSYTVKFAKDIKTASVTGTTVSYDPSLTHRLMVGVRSTPTVAQLNDGSTISNFYNEKYFVKDFIPATPAVAPTVVRDMVTTAACNECHGKIGVTTPHGGRGDVRYCMMCHTSQRTIGQTNATEVNGAFTAPLYNVSPTNSRFDANQVGKAVTNVVDGVAQGDFVVMVHKIHMGKKLTKQGYNYAGVFFNGITYPKEVTNCRQCHNGDVPPAQLALAPQANNWKTKPSRKTCGACHDGLVFATHKGGQTTDANCAGCHDTTDVENRHMTVNATPNNPNTPAGLTNFFYDIKSVDVADNGTTSVATIKFKIQQNTGSLTAAKTDVVFDGPGSTASTAVPANAVLPGYKGSPTFLLAYFKDTANQAAAANSADYNNLGFNANMKAAQPISITIASLMVPTGTSGKKGTLTGPDSTGYYTAVLSGVNNNFPVGATLRAVGLQAYFTQLVGTGSITTETARHSLSIVKEVTGDAKRREVIDSAKCANCHEWFEGHGGNRVVGKDTKGQSICGLCHVPNLSTSGRGAQQSLMQFILTQPVDTSLSAVTNFLATSTLPAGSPFGATSLVTQEAKDAIAALNVTFPGLDPTTFPEASNNFKDMIHGVHAGGNALVVASGGGLKFVRDRGTSGDFDYNFSGVVFPSVLKDCRACHKDTFTSSGAVDASKATYTSIPAKVQVSTQETTRGNTLTLQTAVGVGNNVTEVDAARKAVPNVADVVTTPFTATCVACHNRPNALAHFKQMGGQVTVRRDAVVSGGEACVTCHGTTGPNAIWNAHRFSVVGE